MKHIYKHLTALLLVFALVVAAASGIENAQAVDLNGTYYLTFDRGGSEFADLQEAAITVDLYKIADAVPIGSDSYSYKARPLYTSLELTSVQDNETWKQLAQEATQPLFARKTVNDNLFASSSASNKLAVSEAGLYLVVPHGEDAEPNEYITELTAKDGSTSIATTVKTASHIYRFSPALISLPGKDDNDVWTYASTINLKPEQQNRYGSLEIVKNLNDYVSGSPATFVFQVDAELDGELVYSEVISMTFSAAGNKSYVLENVIPVGAEVTVTEVYSGVCYKLVTDEIQTTTILAEDIVSVTFINESNDSANNGGGITNRFEYKDEDGWTWNPIKHTS